MKRRSVILLCAVGLSIGGAAAAWAAFTSSTSTPSHSFSAAASFCTGNAYSPVWMTGFEAGVASANGGGIYDAALNVTADSSVKRSGNYSMRLDATGSGAYTASAVGSQTATFRFAIRFPSLPAANVTSISGTTMSSGSGVSIGYRSSDQKLTLAWTGGSTSASLSSISAGTWYVIDFGIDASANPRTADWRIDGVSQPSASIAQASATIDYVGTGTNLGSDVFSANYDDLLLTASSADYPIGPGSILALRPNGAGTHNTATNFRDDDTTAIDANSWQRLDESPMSATTDYVAQIANSTTSYLNWSFENPSATCIKAVVGLVAYTSATTTANTGKTSVFTGLTERVVFSGDMSESPALFYRSATIAPSGVSAWTNALVSALTMRTGYAGDASPNPRWQSLAIMYEAQ